MSAEHYCVRRDRPQEKRPHHSCLLLPSLATNQRIFVVAGQNLSRRPFVMVDLCYGEPLSWRSFVMVDGHELLDISAAFDMSGHYTLFRMLQTTFGIYGTKSVKSLRIFLIEVRWLHFWSSTGLYTKSNTIVSLYSLLPSPLIMAYLNSSMTLSCSELYRHPTTPSTLIHFSVDGVKSRPSSVITFLL